jgi:hypothetical protein
MNIYTDSKMREDPRRQELYNGSLFVQSGFPGVSELCQLARELIEEAFRPLDPRTAQNTLPVEQCVEILALLKPHFIHHPKAKECIQRILTESGCDLEATYFDVPRLRTAFPGDYLSSGIAYAFHPHRDTWYSAPLSQLNWWLPVYEIHPDNCMAFHPRYWDEAVPNTSKDYNYYEWNRVNRKSAAQHVRTDTRVQPHAIEPLELNPQIRLLPAVGSAILFSGAQMHSTVPNSSGVTRFSIDFRTVNIADLREHRGAKNLDSASTGTTLHDYLRGSDLSHLPEDLVALYADETETDFVPSPVSLEELIQPNAAKTDAPSGVH